MRTVVVEVGAPCGDEIAGMTHVFEQVLIQAFIPHASVEAFHKSVLHRFSRGDVTQPPNPGRSGVESVPVSFCCYGCGQTTISEPPTLIRQLT